MNLRGDAPPFQDFEDEGPDGEIGDQFNEVRQNDFIVRNVAAPKITVSDPFDAANTLSSLQTHVKTGVGMSLIDPALSAQIDQLLQTAIDAAGRNNTKGVMTAIGDIRKLLKKEHPGIDSEDDMIGNG